jgi:hypothetical protein
MTLTSAVEMSTFGHWFMANRGRFILLMLLLGALIGVPLWLGGADPGLALALALGFPSFIYASVQFSVAADTVSRLVKLDKARRSDTRRLEQQLSTRRLGGAPRFMSDIVGMLRGAKHEVMICCDFPAYGAASDSKAYDDYVKALRHLRRDVEIKLLVLDENVRRGIAEEFHSQAGNKSITDQFPGRDEFLTFVREKNTEALDGPFGDAEKIETSFVMPVFFWIVDDKAVFSLRRPAKTREVEVGFQTSDRQLISALKGVFQRYREMSADYRLVARAAAAPAPEV